MLIRAVQVSRGPSHPRLTNHQRVESHRTEKGPRQRLVLHLGSLALPRERWRELAAALEVGITGQQALFPSEPDIAALAEELLMPSPRRRPGDQDPGSIELSPLISIHEIDSTRIAC